MSGRKTRHWLTTNKPQLSLVDKYTWSNNTSPTVPEENIASDKDTSSNKTLPIVTEALNNKDTVTLETLQTIKTSGRKTLHQLSLSEALRATDTKTTFRQNTFLQK